MTYARCIVIVALTVLLLLVLYLPAATAPAQFVAVIKADHAATTRYWGDVQALGMLRRAMAWQVAAEPAPIPAQSLPKATAGIDRAMQSEVAALGERVTGSAYFRSMQAMMLLASYRAAVMCQSAIVLALMLVAAVVDGLVVRSVRQKEFVEHNPEKCTLAACSTVILCCGMALACALPMALPSAMMPGMGALVCISIRSALANYQKGS